MSSNVWMGALITSQARYWPLTAGRLDTGPDLAGPNIYPSFLRLQPAKLRLYRAQNFGRSRRFGRAIVCKNSNTSGTTPTMKWESVKVDKVPKGMASKFKKGLKEGLITIAVTELGEIVINYAKDYLEEPLTEFFNNLPELAEDGYHSVSLAEEVGHKIERFVVDDIAKPVENFFDKVGDEIIKEAETVANEVVHAANEVEHFVVDDIAKPVEHFVVDDIAKPVEHFVVDDVAKPVERFFDKVGKTVGGWFKSIF